MPDRRDKFRDSDFNGAVLHNTRIKYSDLRNAKGLEQSQLDQALFIVRTELLPKGLSFPERPGYCPQDADDSMGLGEADADDSASPEDADAASP